MAFKGALFPFPAIVNQEKVKRALLLNIINPSIGGVLIRGDKGTGKSTMVRALSRLLPKIPVVKGCPFSCDPFDRSNLCPLCQERIEKGEELEVEYREMKVVDLPLGATEDRVVGTLDIEKALKEGEKAFQPGILAEANRGILYVDEVNLLSDHIVDILLDAAAMGVNIVEREGVSFTHPARFVLVGTMNPEEGELRPQLLDRFGLCVEIKTIMNPQDRIEVMKRRLEFEENPEAFQKKWEEEERKLRERIERAKELLPKVKVTSEVYTYITAVSINLKVDGHRPDIFMLKTAVTNAAFEGREEVTDKDVVEAASLVLPHRLKKRPFEETSFEEADVYKIIEDVKKNLRSTASQMD